MGIAFPVGPSIGETHEVNGVVWKWDGAKWIIGQATGFLPKRGGKLSGPLILARDPVDDDEAVTRGYADAVYSGFVNKLRNGTFDVWQRGYGPFAGGFYPGATAADGWMLQGETSTASREVGFLNGNGLTITGSNSTLRTRIESSIAASLAGQRCTLQFYFRNNTGQHYPPRTFAVHTKYAEPTDNWINGGFNDDVIDVETEVPIGATRQIAITFNVSAGAVNGYELNFLLSSSQLSGAGRSITLSDFDFRATPGWPIGPCDNPPRPEVRPIDIENIICRRYFETTYQPGVAPGRAFGNTNFDGTVRNYYSTPAAVGARSATLFWWYKTTKRVVPTVVVYSANSGATNRIWDSTSGDIVPVGALSATLNHYSLYAATGASQQMFNFLAHFTASAEL